MHRMYFDYNTPQLLLGFPLLIPFLTFWKQMVYIQGKHMCPYFIQLCLLFHPCFINSTVWGVCEIIFFNVTMSAYCLKYSSVKAPFIQIVESPHIDFFRCGYLGGKAHKHSWGWDCSSVIRILEWSCKYQSQHWTKVRIRASKMAQWVRVLALKTDSWNSHARRRTWLLQIVIWSIHVYYVTWVHVQTHTQHTEW